MQKNGFDNLRGGLNGKAIVIISTIYIVISIVVLKSNIAIIDKEAVKTDIILSVILNLLLLLSILKFKDGKNKITIFIKKHYMKAVVLLLLILSTTNLVYNANHSIEITERETRTLNQNSYATLTNINDNVINNLKVYDNTLYRMENKFLNISNSALVHNYNGISYSGSTYSEKLHSFIEKMGIRKAHVFISYNMENTKTSDMLLGIKYLILPPNKEMYKDYPVEYEELYIENNARIYKNPYYLSLGYAVNKDILSTNMDNYNTFTLQNEMLKNMTGIDREVYNEHKGEVKETIEGLDKEGIEYRNLQENAKITYEMEVESTDNMYMYIIANSGLGTTIYINGVEIAAHSSMTNNEMINIGKREIGEKIIIEIVPYADINIEGYFAYYENEEALEEHYQELSKVQVSMQEINRREYEGIVDVKDSSKTILFTIPYDEGWKITDNGKDVEYKKAFDGLITIDLEEGIHELNFKYTTKGALSGAILSILGVTISLIISIMSKKSKNK